MTHKILLTAALLATAALPAAPQLRILGTGVVEIEAERRAGYSTVYVLQDAMLATLEYTASTSNVSWDRFSRLGAAYAEPAPGVSRNGSVYTLSPGDADMGYAITDGSNTTYLWIVNYENHRWDASTARVDESRTDCGRTVVETDATEEGGGEIPYYGIAGDKFDIDRDILVAYNTLSFDAESEAWREVRSQEHTASVTGGVSLPAPLCDTRFTVSPDRFTRVWYPEYGDLTTESYSAVAVEAHTSASQLVESADNEQKSEGAEGSLGGSGPCEITFKAEVTDAAVFRRWEISLTADFEDAELAFDQLEFTHTFADAGTRYVRFTADNAAGTCLYTGETYQVGIGESSLLCPNAFSPGASEGVNDEWKVSYRSIVSFDCQIFNRWGKKLATLSDPSQGWDGKVGGKVVPSGVYFYVIKARGTDGKDYKLSGDINVINSRQNTGLSGGSDAVE